jgi:adenylylsulfate kinase
VRELRRQRLRPLLLDGEELRVAFEGETPVVDRRPEMRLLRAWRLAKLARIAAMQGIPTVVATISLFHAVQHWNRSGPAPYAEVVLQAEVASLRDIRPELYGSQAHAGPPHVVGKDIPAQFPLRPELVLVQRFERADSHSHLQQVLALWRTLDARRDR